MLLDHHSDPTMVKTLMIDSDSEDGVVLDKRKNISEYDSSESNSDENEATSLTSDSELTSGIRPQATEIREVWAYNLYEEFMNISRLVPDFPFVAMDTEFPGIVAKPIGNFSSMDEYKYQLGKNLINEYTSLKD